MINNNNFNVQMSTLEPVHPEETGMYFISDTLSMKDCNTVLSAFASKILRILAQVGRTASATAMKPHQLSHEERMQLGV